MFSHINSCANSYLFYCIFMEDIFVMYCQQKPWIIKFRLDLAGVLLISLYDARLSCVVGFVFRLFALKDTG